MRDHRRFPVHCMPVAVHNGRSWFTLVRFGLVLVCLVASVLADSSDVSRLGAVGHLSVWSARGHLSTASTHRHGPEGTGGSAVPATQSYDGREADASERRHQHRERGRCLRSERVVHRVHRAEIEQRAIQRDRRQPGKSVDHDLLRRRAATQRQHIEHRPRGRRSGRVRARAAERALRAQRAWRLDQRHEREAVAVQLVGQPVRAVRQ